MMSEWDWGENKRENKTDFLTHDDDCVDQIKQELVTEGVSYF